MINLELQLKLFRFCATMTVLRDWSSTINCICFINYMLVFNYICFITNYMLDLNYVVNQISKSFYPNGQANAVWPCIQPCSFQNLVLSFQASYRKIKIEVLIQSKLPNFSVLKSFNTKIYLTDAQKKTIVMFDCLAHFLKLVFNKDNYLCIHNLPKMCIPSCS